jgi:hypothetical protein
MTADIPGYTEDQAADFFAEHVRLAAEALHPDLEPYVEDGPLGKQLRHPLVYQVPLLINGHANQMYEHKLRQLERAEAENNYPLLVYLYERPYRLQALVDLFLQKEIPDEKYWELLGDVFTDTENAWQNKSTWQMLFASDRPFRFAMMRPEDVAAFEALPDVVTIYRGCNYANKNGLSWSLSEETAQFFADRFYKNDNTGMILEAQVKKSDVIALLNHRNEQEILLFDIPDYKKLR